MKGRRDEQQSFTIESWNRMALKTNYRFRIYVYRGAIQILTRRETSLDSFKVKLEKNQNLTIIPSCSKAVAVPNHCTIELDDNQIVDFVFTPIATGEYIIQFQLFQGGEFVGVLETEGDIQEKLYSLKLGRLKVDMDHRIPSSYAIMASIFGIISFLFSTQNIDVGSALLNIILQYFFIAALVVVGILIILIWKRAIKPVMLIDRIIPSQHLKARDIKNVTGTRIEILPKAALIPTLLDKTNWLFQRSLAEKIESYLQQGLIKSEAETLVLLEIELKKAISFDNGDDTESPNYTCLNGYVYSLNLKNMNLTKIPDSALKLGKLAKLDASNNQLITLNDTIDDLGSLESLIMKQNKIKVLPPSIGNLKSLKSLDLGMNDLESLPETIGSLHGLEYLNLAKNKLTSLPKTLQNLHSLKEFDISDNKIFATTKKDAVTRFVDSVRQNLNLSDIFSSLSALRRLDLNNCGIENIPDNIANLQNLEWLELRDNSLEYLPDTISTLSSLKHLDLAYNHFTTLPEEINELQSLVELELKGNPMTFKLESRENTSRTIQVKNYGLRIGSANFAAITRDVLEEEEKKESCIICREFSCKICGKNLESSNSNGEICKINCPNCNRVYHKHCWDQTIANFGKCAFCLKPVKPLLGSPCPVCGGEVSSDICFDCGANICPACGSPSEEKYCRKCGQYGN